MYYSACRVIHTCLLVKIRSFISSHVWVSERLRLDEVSSPEAVRVRDSGQRNLILSPRSACKGARSSRLCRFRFGFLHLFRTYIQNTDLHDLLSPPQKNEENGASERLLRKFLLWKCTLHPFKTIRMYCYTSMQNMNSGSILAFRSTARQKEK